MDIKFISWVEKDDYIDFNKEKENLWKKDFLDKEKIETVRNLQFNMFSELIVFLVEKHMYITPLEHQVSKIPLFDNKYIIVFSYKTWSSIMATVWNNILNTNEFTYIDFYYTHDCPEKIKEFREKENGNYNNS